MVESWSLMVMESWSHGVMAQSGLVIVMVAMVTRADAGISVSRSDAHGHGLGWTY